MILAITTVVGVVLAVVAAHVATTAVVRWSRSATVRHPVHPTCAVDPGHRVAWREVVPVVSWLAHRGTCRSCGARIPRHLLVVELATMAVVVASALLHPWPRVLLVAPVAWSAVVATPIDLAHRIIPNRLTLPLGAWSLAVATALATWTGAWGQWRLAMLVGFGVPLALLAISLVFELLRGSPGMGMGDVKWSLSIGVAVGWLGPMAVVVWLYGTVGASAVALVTLLATGRAQLAQRVPYGPYLAVGALLALLGLPLVT